MMALLAIKPVAKQQKQERRKLADYPEVMQKRKVIRGLQDQERSLLREWEDLSPASQVVTGGRAHSNGATTQQIKNVDSDALKLLGRPTDHVYRDQAIVGRELAAVRRAIAIENQELEEIASRLRPEIGEQFRDEDKRLVAAILENGKQFLHTVAAFAAHRAELLGAQETMVSVGLPHIDFPKRLLAPLQFDLDQFKTAVEQNHYL